MSIYRDTHFSIRTDLRYKRSPFRRYSSTRRKQHISYLCSPQHQKRNSRNSYRQHHHRISSTTIVYQAPPSYIKHHHRISSTTIVSFHYLYLCEADNPAKVQILPKAYPKQETRKCSCNHTPSSNSNLSFCLLYHCLLFHSVHNETDGI